MATQTLAPRSTSVSVTSRIVSPKNQTIGFSLSSGETITSAQAYARAKKSQLANATPVAASNGEVTKQSIRLTTGSIHELKKVIAPSIHAVTKTTTKKAK